MQCPSCHQEASGTFCNLCGAQLAAASAGAAPGSAIPAATAGGLSENAAAAISYITIIPSILFLLLDPYRRMRLVRFHSVQNLLLAAAWIVAWIAVTILEVALHFIPLIGILFMLANLAIAIGFFVAWLIALIKASKGEYFKLPLIGDMAMKMANS